MTRVPINRVLPDDAATPEPRQEGDTLVIPVVEEELLVFKRRVLKEEVNLFDRHIQCTVTPVNDARGTVRGVCVVLRCWACSGWWAMQR